MARAVCALVALGISASSGCLRVSGLEQGFQGSTGLEGASAAPLLETIQARKPPPQVAGVVGVTGTGLVGRTLPEGKRWEYTGAVETLPILVSGFVAVSGNGKVVLLDLHTGKPAWPNPLSTPGRQLSGMTHDGENFLLILTDPDDSRPQRLIVTGRDGVPRAQAESEAGVGTPVALEGLALVPWDGLYVTVLDLVQGTSIGRLQTASITTAAEADAGGVLLFGQGVRRLEDVFASPRAALTLPDKKMPGDPHWPPNGMATRAPRAFPIALYAHPEIEAGRLRLAQSTFASTYYRVVLGFGAHYGELRWATYFQRDVLGGATSSDGLTLCLEDGSLWSLAWRDGARASRGNLKARLRACVVSPDPHPAEVTRPGPLALQVASTLTDTGPDMAPVHQLLLDELSENPSPEVTRLLLDIARSPRAAADLAEQTARRIALRRTGAEYLIAALEDSVDFDVTKRPAPLGAVATALAAMHAGEGAPALAQHLVDPRTSLLDQLMVARALRVLATPEQVPELGQYFSLYRTAASEPLLAQTVLLTAHTLWTVGGEAGQRLVIDAASDPMTHPLLRPALENLIATQSESPAGAPQPEIPPKATDSEPSAPGVIHPERPE